MQNYLFFKVLKANILLGSFISHFQIEVITKLSKSMGELLVLIKIDLSSI